MNMIYVNSLDKMLEYMSEYWDIQFPEKTDVVFTWDFSEWLLNSITVYWDLYIWDEVIWEKRETIIYWSLKVTWNIKAYNHLHIEYWLNAHNIKSTSSIYVRKWDINCNIIQAKSIYAGRGIKANYIESLK